MAGDGARLRRAGPQGPKNRASTGATGTGAVASLCFYYRAAVSFPTVTIAMWNDNTIADDGTIDLNRPGLLPKEWVNRRVLDATTEDDLAHQHCIVPSGTIYV